jgi:hypothetical protein
MDRACEQLLAGARLTGNQRDRVGAGDHAGLGKTVL